MRIDDGAALNRRVAELRTGGRSGEALPLAEQAVALAERLSGPEHPAVADPLLELAEVLGGLGRPADGEAPERRALAIREKALGPDHPDTAAAVVALAGTFRQTGRRATSQ